MPKDGRLIVGLGNPGKKYDVTRHNMGFWVLDSMAEHFSGIWRREDLGLISSITLDDSSISLLKPLTWMNRSGLAVHAYLERLGFSMSQLIVICDDISLPDGQIRIRTQGSSGGHNGLSSIIEFLDSTEFTRLRIGVGSSRDQNTDLSDFVLETLSQESREAYGTAVSRACDAILVAIKQGIQTAMTEYNRIVTNTENLAGNSVAPDIGGDE